eukprot:480527_1
MGVSSSVDRESTDSSAMHSSPKSSISLSSTGSESISRSRSPSNESIVCSTSRDSSQSTLISRRFVSYENENAIICIQRNNNRNRSQSWSFRLVPKHTQTTESSPDKSFVVFGMCNKEFLDSSAGHNHKWYGYGYSVTYCQGYKLASYVASFKVGAVVTIKYNTKKRQISIWCDGMRKKRFFNVEHHPLHEFALTIKSYHYEYAIQMMQ